MAAATIELIARAIKECTDKFSAPVGYYIEPEAQHRWEEANPDGNWYEAAASSDELASYRIIAEAIVSVVSAPRDG